MSSFLSLLAFPFTSITHLVFSAFTGFSRTSTTLVQRLGRGTERLVQQAVSSSRLRYNGAVLPIHRAIPAQSTITSSTPVSSAAPSGSEHCLIPVKVVAEPAGSNVKHASNGLPPRVDFFAVSIVEEGATPDFVNHGLEHQPLVTVPLNSLKVDTALANTLGVYNSADDKLLLTPSFNSYINDEDADPTTPSSTSSYAGSLFSPSPSPTFDELPLSSDTPATSDGEDAGESGRPAPLATSAVPVSPSLALPTKVAILDSWLVSLDCACTHGRTLDRVEARAHGMRFILGEEALERAFDRYRGTAIRIIEGRGERVLYSEPEEDRMARWEVRITEEMESYVQRMLSQGVPRPSPWIGAVMQPSTSPCKPSHLSSFFTPNDIEEEEEWTDSLPPSTLPPASPEPALACAPLPDSRFALEEDDDDLPPLDFGNEANPATLLVMPVASFAQVEVGWNMACQTQYYLEEDDDDEWPSLDF
ncbi:hypothetical protein JCM11641_005270 [Rhodosporidiobolus odoratus]